MYLSLSRKIDSSSMAFLNLGVPFIVFFCGLASSMRAQNQTSPQSTAAEAQGAPKTHTLFMGADFDVLQHKKFWRVEGVQGAAFIINENNEKIFVPTDSGALSLKVLAELKLSGIPATIVNYKVERSYTRENDPRTKFVRENPGTVQDAQSDIGVANAVLGGAAARRPAGDHEPVSQVAARQQLGRTSAGAEIEAGANALSFNQSTAAFVNRMESDLEKELFDAMEVRFTVSSAKRLIDPYVVLVATYREKDEKAGTAHSWIYAHQLRPIDEHPRKEYILQGGLPPGFELVNCELHLYNRGQEVGTTVSPKRVELTREEAFEYLLIDYIGSHKGATLDAAPFMGELPADLTSKLSADQLRSTYFAKVSDEGVPLGVYSDEACTHKLGDLYIENIIGDLRFKPALDKGKAVPGVARIKLNHLSLQA